MNYPDLIVIVLIAIGSWVGYKRGFINTVLLLLKWLLAVTGAIYFYIPLSTVIKENFAVQEQWLFPLSFGIVFAVFYFPIHILGKIIQRRIRPEIHRSLLNKRAGLVPGLIAGLCMVVMSVKLILLSEWHSISVTVRNSATPSLIEDNTAWLNASVADIFNNKPGTQISEAFEAKEGLNQSPEFKSDQYTEVPILEIQLLNFVNAERIKRHVRPVTADLLMQHVAAVHTVDMFVNGYFSHSDLEGKTPFDRLRKWGVLYTVAGENLAHSYDLQSAHAGLMNSPGHRSNILNPKFGRLGICVLDGGENGLMIAEEFRN